MIFLVTALLLQDDEEHMVAEFRTCQQLWIDAQVACSANSPLSVQMLTRFIERVENDFLWRFEQYLAAYKLLYQSGVACYQLTQLGAPGRWWKRCFSALARTASLMRDPAAAVSVEIRRLALEARSAQVRYRRIYARQLPMTDRDTFDRQTDRLVQEAYRFLPEASASRFSA